MASMLRLGMGAFLFFGEVPVSLPIQKLVRLASQLLTAYQRRSALSHREQSAAWSCLELRFERARHIQRLLEQAGSRGWHYAAEHQRDELQSVLRCIDESVRQVQNETLESRQEHPCLTELLIELRSIHQEFDDVTIESGRFLAVRTETIVLEGVHLGSFSIQLHWPRLARQGDDCIEIVALDPNPARANEDVTHPHVRSRVLCAGDATVPLKKALEQGRLTDVFQIIHSVLRTYNGSSAFASLDEWDGTSCWNCGYAVSEDDRSYCDGCDQDICSECTSLCKHCDCVRCTSCRTTCEECSETCCRRCLKKSEASELMCCKDCIRACAICGAEVASSELEGDTECCPTCSKAEESKETETPEDNKSIAVPTP